MDELKAVNNKKQSRFEIALPDGEYATLDYRWLKGDIVLMHTLVPVTARGKGLGSILAKYALDYTREQNLKTLVYCAFVAKYIKDHPEYSDLVRHLQGS